MNPSSPISPHEIGRLVGLIHLNSLRRGWTEAQTSAHLGQELFGALTTLQNAKTWSQGLKVAAALLPDGWQAQMSASYEPGMEERVRLGTFLRQTAGSQGLSAEELATRLEMPPALIHNLYLGVPSGLDDYLKVAMALELPTTPSDEPANAPLPPRDAQPEAADVAPTFTQDSEVLAAIHDMFEALTGQISRLEQHILELNGRLAALEGTAASTQTGDGDLYLEHVAPFSGGVLIYRSDGEVFVIDAAGEMTRATSYFGMPGEVGGELRDVSEWTPKRKKR